MQQIKSCIIVGNGPECENDAEGPLASADRLLRLRVVEPVGLGAAGETVKPVSRTGDHGW